MTRRVTTTRRSDAHDPTKKLLKSASAASPGRHRSALETPSPAPRGAPVGRGPRRRRVRTPEPKM